MRVMVRDSTALAVGSALSGLLAYVFFALVTRTLGAVAAAPVSVLWTYWSFAAAALTFPLQHWIIRSVTARAGEGPVRRALPRVATVVLCVAVISATVSWLARAPLFHRDDAWFPVLVGVVTVGSGFVGVVRGALTARLRFVAVAWALVAENAARCAAAATLMLVSVRESMAYGAGLAAGQLVGFLWPSALRFRGDDGAEHHEPWAAFIGGAAGGQVIGQTILTGGPVVLALSGGSPAEVTALFAGLALFRAPYTLALGVMSQATGQLTRLVVGRQVDALRKVRIGVVALTLVGTALAALVGGLVGPALVRLVFGSGVVLDPRVALLTAVGSAVALGNLALTVTVMAQNRTAAVLRAWVVAALAATVLLLAGQSPSVRTSNAFACAELAAFLILLLEEVRGTRALATVDTMVA